MLYRSAQQCWYAPSEEHFSGFFFEEYCRRSTSAQIRARPSSSQLAGHRNDRIVLGMLVSAARSSYNARYGELVKTSVDILMLDRLLANYSPEAQDARSELRSAVQSTLERAWGDPLSVRVEVNPSQKVEGVYDKVLALLVEGRLILMS